MTRCKLLWVYEPRIGRNKLLSLANSNRGKNTGVLLRDPEKYRESKGCIFFKVLVSRYLQDKSGRRDSNPRLDPFKRTTKRIGPLASTVVGRTT